LVNLMLARNASRARDLAVRFSLGASRARLIGQSLAKSASIAAGGAAMGLLVAYGMLALVVRMADGTIPRLDVVSIDMTTLLSTTALAIVTTLATGTAPALLSARAASVVKTGN